MARLVPSWAQVCHRNLLWKQLWVLTRFYKEKRASARETMLLKQRSLCDLRPGWDPEFKPAPCHWQHVPSERACAFGDASLGQDALSMGASHSKIWATVPSCWHFPSRPQWLWSQSRHLHSVVPSFISSLSPLPLLGAQREALLGWHTPPMLLWSERRPQQCCWQICIWAAGKQEAAEQLYYFSRFFRFFWSGFGNYYFCLLNLRKHIFLTPLAGNVQDTKCWKPQA